MSRETHVITLDRGNIGQPKDFLRARELKGDLAKESKQAWEDQTSGTSPTSRSRAVVSLPARHLRIDRAESSSPIPY